MDCRVEGTLFNLKHLLCQLADPLGDTITMHGAERERLQDQEIQGSLW